MIAGFEQPTRGRILLGGQRGVPRRLLDAGFTFEHPSFEPALRAVLTTA